MLMRARRIAANGPCLEPTFPPLFPVPGERTGNPLTLARSTHAHAASTHLRPHTMATEQKKEAFRKYLESSGVIDSLTKVLVSLYEEPDKPATAIDFLKANLGGPTPAEFEALSEERNALAAELETCKKELAEAQAKLEGAGAVTEGAEEGEEAPAE